MKSWTLAYKSHILYITRRGKFTKEKKIQPCTSINIWLHIPICISRSKQPRSNNTDILYLYPSV